MKKEIKIESLRSILSFSDNYNAVMDAINTFISKVKECNSVPEIEVLERELKRIAEGQTPEYE